MAKAGELTDKQTAFVEEYLRNGRNAAAAYRSAYNTKGQAQHVAERACKLLRNTKVAAIVTDAEQRAAAAMERVVDRYAVTRERVVSALAQLAFSDIRQVMQWADGKLIMKPSEDLTPEETYAISEIQELGGGRLRVRVSDKHAALLALCRMQGWITDRREVRVIRSVEDLTDDELAALAATTERRADR